MLVKLQIPENTYATVVLEQAELSGLTEGGRPIAACEEMCIRDRPCCWISSLTPVRSITILDTASSPQAGG